MYLVMGVRLAVLTIAAWSVAVAALAGVLWWCAAQVPGAPSLSYAAAFGVVGGLAAVVAAVRFAWQAPLVDGEWARRGLYDDPKGLILYPRRLTKDEP